MYKIASIGRPSNCERLTNILHNLEIGEAIATKHPDAYRLANSISRTTKRYGIRLSTTKASDQTTVIEAVEA